MKNLSLILNVILFIAVGYLYVLHFGKKEQSGTNDATGTIPALPVSAGGIVYVNSDSLLEQYEFTKNQKAQLEASQDRIKNELKAQGERLQKEIEEYQQQAVGMTDMQRQQKEEQLAMKQQQYLERRDEALAKLDEEQSRTSEELYDRLAMYLKEFNKDKNYQFILGYQRGGGILFANDSLNITRQVIEGLNNQYRNK